MVLQLRLKKDSPRQFFTTQMGHTIDRDHWETVVHNDKDIDFLLQRHDIEKRTVDEEINEMVTEDSSKEEVITEIVEKPKKTSKKKASKKKVTKKTTFIE